MRLLGRFIGSGYCACRDCGRPIKRADKRRQWAREKRELRVLINGQPAPRDYTVSL